ncbi:helicase domain protein, partial [Emiliania huxleyi CCMP1516]|uniref:Helicase-associated domain-containing protein n=2 Tax=Emiliania huxleyi TaxID=2903 RepID=A0A0D3JEU6_EMIH1
WEQRFGELQAYKARFGNCRVPRGWSEKPQLAKWVDNQRQAKRKFDQGDERASITQPRFERLTGIGFEWDPAADLWEQRFGELQAYKARFGNCRVPRGWSEKPQLATWVDNQRTAKRNFDQGDERSITQPRFERLTGIGFEWDRAADLWEQRFGELQAYKARFGNCNVP